MTRRCPLRSPTIRPLRPTPTKTNETRYHTLSSGFMLVVPPLEIDAPQQYDRQALRRQIAFGPTAFDSECMLENAHLFRMKETR